MNQEKLEKARNYEEQYGAQISAQERPLFHVTPTVGWLNDPNGFSIYQGEYHLFYQYYPYDINWGPTHWGHVKSSDLIKWERLPVSLAPDQEYDSHGVFSGSAVSTKEGRHLLMYTGVKGKDQTPECRQTQCIAYGDGKKYEKYEGNPVITEEDLPEGCSGVDFRDPKIWWEEEENCFYAVAASRTSDGSGAVLLFSSPEGRSWKYVTILDCSNNQYGKMWECPDFFELNDRTALIVSAQEMRARGLEFHNGYDVCCLLGDYDKVSRTFTRKKIAAVDYGLDFYAPQSIETPDGRRVMIGWMQCWESNRFHPDGTKWAGMHTIPRELSLVNDQLIQKPVRELLNYRKNQVLHKGIRLEGRMELPDVSGRILDMTVEIRPEGEELYQGFTIYIAENEEYSSFLHYDPRKNTVCFDRTYSGFPYNIVSRREAPVREQNGSLQLRIVMDRFSVEIFINHGEQVMSSCLYTPQEADGISFEAEGKVQMDVEKYDIVVP